MRPAGLIDSGGSPQVGSVPGVESRRVSACKRGPGSTLTELLVIVCMAFTGMYS